MSTATKLKEAPNRKKLTVQKIDLSNADVGFSFKGKFVGTSMSDPFNQTDPQTGEVVTKQITFAVFENETGERFKVAQDAGLRQAMADALVKEGQTIEVVKLEKIKLGRGRTMNQYDIYSI